MEYIRVDEAAQLEGVNSKTLLRRFLRKRVIMANDGEDGRKKLVPLSALSPGARQARLKIQVCTALQGISEEKPEQAIVPAGDTSAAVLAQPRLPFAPTSAEERARADAVPPGLPLQIQKLMDQWSECLGDCTDGTWRIHAHKNIPYGGFTIRNRTDFIRAEAHIRGKGFSETTIRRNLRIVKEVFTDPGIAKETGPRWAAIYQRLLPKARPGRSGHTFFDQPQNAWMFPVLRGFYLDWHKPSVRHAWQKLYKVIDLKQEAAGLDEIYEKPTLCQCRIALKKIDWPSRIMGREGEEAYRNRCEQYLSRNPESLQSNDLWVTDQRVANVILQDDGHRLGRIWMVNDLDVASFKWLGVSFAPILSSSMVMQAHARALARYGIPRAIHHDQGKEFKATAFNGTFHRISRETLYGKALGLWRGLGVDPIGAIGGNAQSKTIERWHVEIDKFDKNFLTWCGTDTDERPDEELSPIIAQHEAWLNDATHRTASPGIPTVQEYIGGFTQWAEKDWNADHESKGKYLCGMTPNEAYNAKRPPAGHRVMSAVELDEKTAEHRFVTVRRGGEVHLTFFGKMVEYEAPELFPFAGAKPPVEVEVVIGRRSFSAVTVWYPVPGGRESCVARAKWLYDWLPEGEGAQEILRAAIRYRGRLKGAVKRGIIADRALAEAANPLELLPTVQGGLPGQKLFGAPGPRPEQEISSAEYMMARSERRRLQPTSEEVAEKALQEMEEAS